MTTSTTMSDTTMTPEQTPPRTVDGVEITAGMKVYWNSGNPKTAEGVTVTSVDEFDAMFDDDGEELWVPLEWACSTREACKAFAVGARLGLSGCPCKLTTPCSESCSCANPLMSGGCQRCALYGSPEQRKAAAERLATLAETEAELARLRREVERLSVLLDEQREHTDAIAKTGVQMYDRTLAGMRAAVTRATNEASDERYKCLKDWEAEAEKWKAEGDMYGWNFHMGMAAGANWCDIFYRRVLRVLAAIPADAPKEGTRHPEEHNG